MQKIKIYKFKKNIDGSICENLNTDTLIYFDVNNNLVCDTILNDDNIIKNKIKEHLYNNYLKYKNNYEKFNKKNII